MEAINVGSRYPSADTESGVRSLHDLERRRRQLETLGKILELKLVEERERGAYDDEVFEVASLEELEDVGEHGAVGDREQRLRDFLQRRRRS